MKIRRCNSVSALALAVAVLLVWAVFAGVSAAPLASRDARKDFEVLPASGPLAGKRIYANSHALLIGINEYAHLPKDTWLSYAVNDVTAMRQVLVDRYGFSPERITVLTNKEASLEGIRRALARLADRHDVQTDDRILVYFSGHGQTVNLASGGEMGFLMPHDADVDPSDMQNPAPFLASCLPMKSVWDYLESTPARHVLLLADACYSGLLARPRAVQEIPEEALVALAGRRAIQVVTAGRRGEVSYELSRYGHGAFTQKLLEELNARAETSGAVFTATELYSAVKRQVAGLSKGKQIPQMGDYDTEGDFIFITASRPPTAPANPHPGDAWVCPTDRAEMVFVPGGPFTMGDDQGDTHERPAHRARVAGFWMDKHEVTNAQFARFLNATGGPKDDHGRILVSVDDHWSQLQQTNGIWQARPNMENHPVVMVTWDGARAYAHWAQKRLPTEAEWEKAARGTDGRKFPWGSDWDPARCQNGDVGASGFPTTTLVGHFPTGASPYGCLDMAGNVWEWTSTLYKPYPYRAGDSREDPSLDGERVLRGAAWNNRLAQGGFRTACRWGVLPSAGVATAGFRCALSPVPLPSRRAAHAEDADR